MYTADLFSLIFVQILLSKNDLEQSSQQFLG
jgi:hypothetical protein